MFSKVSSVICVLIIAGVLKYCETGRILGIIAAPSYSHQIVFRPLWAALSLKGHQVTLLTTDPMHNRTLTNLTEIDLSFTYGLFKQSDVIKKLSETETSNFMKIVHTFFAIGSLLLSAELNHPDVRKLLKNETEFFDVVMVEYLFPELAVLGERFNCPVIGLTSLDAPARVYQLMGSPTHPVLDPDTNFPVAFGLNFYQRFISAVTRWYEEYYLDFYGYPYISDPMLTKLFGNKYPAIKEIIFKRTSMLFVNVNPILKIATPKVPTIIEIGGGTHLDPLRTLPQDLQDFLDDSKNGFIYCSFGTNVKSESISNETRDILVEVFSKLPHKVLWKFDAQIPKIYRNIKIAPWVPQQDVLRHSLIKVFITQGGLQSLEEAMYAYVPLVVIPFLFDQNANAQKIVAKGFGQRLDHRTLNKQSLENTLLEVIENRAQYQKNIKKAVELATDQPMTGLQKAVWWTEYVIRHKGAKHLRSPLLDIPSYQYYFLDIVLAFSLLSLVVICIVVKIIRKVTGMSKRSKNNLKFKSE